MQTIDIHNHWLPKAYVDGALRGDFGEVVKAKEYYGETALEFRGHDITRTSWVPIMASYNDWQLRFSDMDKAGLDRTVVSHVPFTFHYGEDPEFTWELHKLMNDELAVAVNQCPQRLKGLANLPMQDIPKAIDELERVVKKLNLSGVQLGSNVSGGYLGEEKFLPFWEAVHSLGAFVLIHPYDAPASEYMKGFHFKNLIGHLLDTTVSAATLIMGGVMEKFPDLQVCLSHGGGQLPYIIGRIDHGYHVRPECKGNPKLPSQYLKRFYYDIITHSARALEYLVATVGSDRVVIGTDYPFDMGLEQPVQIVDSLSVDAATKELIKGKNIAAIL